MGYVKNFYAWPPKGGKNFFGVPFPGSEPLLNDPPYLRLLEGAQALYFFFFPLSLAKERAVQGGEVHENVRFSLVIL